MLKPITLHPSSVLVGLGLAALVALASGAAQSAGSGRPVPNELRVVGHIPASWWTSVYVAGSTSFVVPADRYFVATAADYQTLLMANGQYVNVQAIQDPSVVWGPGAAGRDTGTRLAFPPGTVLSSSGGQAQLWGYLEPVR